VSDRLSPLHDLHVNAGASFTDFGGWQMPVRYSSDLAEHHAVRTAAGIFDISHMAEILVEGADAGAFLDYALAGRLSAIALGQAKYSLLLAPTGGIIDDLVVYRLDDTKFLVVANAGNRDAAVAALTERAGAFDVLVQDQSDDIALIAVQGPNSRAILEATTAITELGIPLSELKYYWSSAGYFEGVPLFIGRTGYTGEDGFELYIRTDAAARLWVALTQAGAEHGLAPAGLASRDTLRLEAGMPLYGNELSLEGDPFAAGLGPVVALSKEGDFVGKAALAAKKEAGAGATAGRKLVGLKGLGRRAGRGHYPVLKDGNVVGEVTSGQPSPSLGYPVAMAYVDVAFTEPGTALEIDLRGKSEPFEVVTLPFYKRAK
jgi:aminomethyltransferase